MPAPRATEEPERTRGDGGERERRSSTPALQLLNVDLVSHQPTFSMIPRSLHFVNPLKHKISKFFASCLCVRHNIAYIF